MKSGTESGTSIDYSFIVNYGNYVSYVLMMIILLLCRIPALAQTQHHLDHPNYQNWINKHSRNCCNNNDCGRLAEADERETVTGGIEVRIEGVWCPVRPHHYLLTGNAPDHSSSHVCVQRSAVWQIIPVCDRLLCYQPKPGI